MPSLSEALQTNTEGYSPVPSEAYNQPTISVPTNDLQPGYNTMIRCPLPPIFQAAPDSLSQFYLNGKVPQTRLLSALINANTSGGSGGTVNESVLISGGVGPTPPPQTLAEQTVIITTVLAPNQQFVSSLNSIGHSFQLLSVASTSPARVQLYGTASAQTNDLARLIDQPVPAGVTQNIITDVVLDTNPLQWFFQNRIGANGDAPQKTVLYITVTNLTGATTPVTVTLQYVPLES